MVESSNMMPDVEPVVFDPEAKRFFVTMASTVQSESTTGVLPSYPFEMTVTDEDTLHHLRTVCRAKVGELVTVVDPAQEQAYQAVITALEKNALTLRVESPLPALLDSLPTVVLAAALLKEQRWDALLQKTVELGVRHIVPLRAERSVVRLSEKDFARKQIRWQAILRAAAEQSEGLFIPSMQSAQSVASLTPFVESDEFQAILHACKPQVPFKETTGTVLKLLLRERGETRLPLKQCIAAWRARQTPEEAALSAIVLAVGPEGGWTANEIRQFQQAGFVEASLGERILRSETAAMAAMAALVYEYGDPA